MQNAALMALDALACVGYDKYQKKLAYPRGSLNTLFGYPTDDSMRKVISLAVQTAWKKE